MVTVKHAISEHDVVVLREPVGSWPAGTAGAVISVYDGSLLVEITGTEGKTLDTIQVPAEGLDAKRGSPRAESRCRPDSRHHRSRT